MASVDGRSTWFAWLVGLVCAGIVAALFWLAAPMGPAVVDWAAGALSGALNPPRPAPSAQAEERALDPAVVTPVAPTACHDLYDPAMWDSLRAVPGSLLDEGLDYPPSAMAALPDALGAHMVMSCAWTADTGAAIVTTLADVSGSAAAVAANALTARGFVCAPVAGDGVGCALQTDTALETHVVRSGVWVATVRTAWDAPGYEASVDARVWPA